MMRVALFCVLFSSCVFLVSSRGTDESALMATSTSASRPNCNTHTDCTACAGASSWVPGSNCRWCPVDNQCHEEGSMYNTCSNSQDITDPDKCSSQPTPTPAPAPTDNGFAVEVLTELFKLLKITDVDASKCANDLGRADVHFRDFGQDLVGKNYSYAATDLARGLSALSTSVADCGASEVQAKLDSLASAIRWANISTSGLDKTVRILVDASDLWNDFDALGTAVVNKDWSSVGSSIGQMLSDWSTITGGCKDSQACQLLDGLLKVVQVVAEDVSPCETALDTPVQQLVSATTLFHSKNYTAALQSFATGLDGIAKAISTDACGLRRVGDTLAALSPKLANATIRIENSTAVSIIVGSAELYDTLFQATEDLINGNHDDFGYQMGQLLLKLQASDCTTKSCTLLQGLLQSLQLELGSNDFTKCASDLDDAWNSVPTAIRLFQAKKWVNGVNELSTLLTSLATGVQDCHLSELATVLENTATKLGSQAAAAAIGEVAQVLVDGSDITLDIQKLIVDFQADQWSSVGHDLGTLSNWLLEVDCTTYACKVVEGLLNAAAIPFQSLAACETDLQTAASSLTAGAAAFATKDYKSGLSYWSSALFSVSKTVQDCGLAKELVYMEQEANVLGFGNVSVLGSAATILIHGQDLASDIDSAYNSFASHDYRGAGSTIGKIMNELSNWTTGHTCSNNFCYVVTGITQYFGDVEGDLKNCQVDFQKGWGNFSTGFQNLLGSGSQGGNDFHFTTNTGDLKRGIRDMGYGLKDVAKGVSDCHLQELADILAQLAAKLELTPEISWLEEFLKIVIDGVEIENEIGDACLDYSQGNWVGFGYNLAKLVKTLA